MCGEGSGCKRPRYELAEIFDKYFWQYELERGVSAFQRKVVRRIQRCRTAALGYHKLVCRDEGCDYERTEYNSCRNRHCPKCHCSKRMEWLARQKESLLPVVYYHGVFTLPHILNVVALYNKEAIYGDFFKSVGNALLAFGRDPKYLGGELGLTGILHTWGQALTQHIHLHFIIPGGGLSNDGTRWVNLPYRKDFLFPSYGLSRRIRQEFCERLQKRYEGGELSFPDELSHLSGRDEFEGYLREVSEANWYCYLQKPMGGPEAVIGYLSRYTHRIAISNDRILDIEGGEISFLYKDYRDEKSGLKPMRLGYVEFIRRYLQHIVPRGFRRIRHYGFLAGSSCKEKLAKARELLQARYEEIKARASKLLNWYNPDEYRKCPKCGGALEVLSVLPFRPG